MVDLNKGQTTVIHADPSAAMDGLVGVLTPVHIQGENSAVGAVIEGIVPMGGQTPFIQAPVQLRIAAGGDVQDTVAGTGAQQIVLVMLDANGEQFEETIDTAGALASSPTAGNALRLVDAFVSRCGLYVFPVNLDTITIETTGGLVVGQMPPMRSKLQNAMYSVPVGNTCTIVHAKMTTDGNPIDAQICYREDFTDMAVPKAVTVIENWYGQTTIDQEFSVGSEIPPLSDIFFSAAKSTGSDAAVAASFDIWLRKIGG